MFPIPPHHRLYAGDQFCRAEWLADVVIRAESKTEYDVGLLVFCCQHDDRSLVALTPHATSDIEPIYSREHQIQNHQVDARVCQMAQR